VKHPATTFVAIGGGELAEASQALDLILKHLHKISDPRLVVMTVATNESRSAAAKYNNLFRSRGLQHVEVVDVSERSDSFSGSSLKKVENADALYFTGGDQLNVTSLLGGSPLHELIRERYESGILIAGTSAGAAMMSSSMILSGESGTAPKVGGVEIGPGMNMVVNTIIDSHFSQRGRHGRLLTAVAHYPQLLGLGIDEQTAAVFKDGTFEVVGQGTVTVFDGRRMKHCDLPYRRDNETIGMFDVCVHVLPSEYSYDLKKREPMAPEMKTMAGGAEE
jgi:cyanophycinase